MNTKQRNIILEKLKQLKTHPTADEIYAIVRTKLPNISLGTVYRNLKQLAENGTILQLGQAGQQKRFDADLSKHYHFVCQKCHKIYDLPAQKIADLKQIPNYIEQHAICGYNLDFYGICFTCNTKEKLL
ncbi:MAG: transcriptional repressor [Gammaproteobacteria bacterium]|nr:transcriptional repressor [Gammaproteobacteria bacterium]